MFSKSFTYIIHADDVLPNTFEQRILSSNVDDVDVDRMAEMITLAIESIDGVIPAGHYFRVECYYNNGNGPNFYSRDFSVNAHMVDAEVLRLMFRVLSGSGWITTAYTRDVLMTSTWNRMPSVIAR
jgi:hypothetical protein